MSPLPRVARWATVGVGKLVRSAAQLRGGGSAFPGLVMAHLDHGFLPETLAQLPHGVAVITGTNGKTTTTKIVVELLRAAGLRVLTNPTGSNFVRGVATALLGAVDWRGRLDYDIAVLELDEAWAVRFAAIVPPRYSLLLNVARDQLDRFGELDHTAGLLRTVAERTTDAVVANRDDARLAAVGAGLRDKRVNFFGVDEGLAARFPGDDQLHGSGRAPGVGRTPADVLLEDVEGGHVRLRIGGRDVEGELALTGAYNMLNAAAALALTRAILGDAAEPEGLMRALAAVTPAFGRGETMVVDGQRLELVLVKNPVGFRLALSSLPPAGYRTMIAINDSAADGRDVSWLWDVDFDSLRPEGVETVSGVRAYDMALRLHYDLVPFGAVEPDLATALQRFLSGSRDHPRRIYCTYTAMLALRRRLARVTPLEAVT